ncbi:MAG: TetR/AcrR family transcriptional regulator [Sandaracinaceae bacterium]|nr:TetR/AcrR family transcriptional regulator [Sandaracinaceae bacterium]
MPRGRYQQKQWDARHAAILEALEQLSDQRGFSNVTMDDLADQIGISKATLYQHFESKDAMLVELMASHEDAFIALLDAMGISRPSRN